MRRMLVLTALLALTAPLFAGVWGPGEGPYNPNPSWEKPGPVPDWYNDDPTDPHGDWDHRDMDGPSEEDEGIIYDDQYYWYWDEVEGCWVRVEG